MGLDISVYSNMKKVECTEREEYNGREWCENWDHVQAYNIDFPERLDRLEQMACYTGEQVSGFRAGSYSGYNLWREKLCRMALEVFPMAVWENPTEYEGEPFFELINMSDCEGTIGPETSAKLFKDFQEHLSRAREYFGAKEDWFMDKYEDWMRGFELAANNGCVRFH